MKEDIFEGASGNYYQAIHGWFEREGREFYFFSWMDESVKGKSFILPAKTDMKKWQPFDIRRILQYEPDNVQAKELFEFITKEFRKHKEEKRDNQ